MGMNNNCACGCSCCGAWLYSAFRIIIGGLFLWHGISKFMIGPSAVAGFLSIAPWMAWLGAILETVGGALILVGFFTSYAAIAGIVDMLGAWFFIHVHKGWNPMSNGGELALVYFAAFLVLHYYGSGSFSIGSLFHKGSCDCDCDCSSEAAPVAKVASKPAKKKARK